MRPGSSWVHPGLLCSIGCALGVVGFIPGRKVHSGAPLGLLGTSAVVGFRPCVRWHHLVSLGSLGCALRVVGFISVRTGSV